MDDFISRQAAIDALGDTHFKNYGNAIMVIQALPSAEPVEREECEYIITKGRAGYHEEYKCSVCGEDVTSTAPCIGFFPNAKVTWDYCPNCGARMDEE